MTKIIKIDGKIVGLKVTAGALIKYKEEFGTEYSAVNAEIQKMLKADDSVEKIAEKALISIKQITWCMADLYAPCLQSEIFSLTFDSDVFHKISTWLHESVDCGKGGDEDGEEFNSENFVAICLECGLTMRDIENYSVKFLINVINRHIDLHKPEKTKKATQADIDMIFGR